MGRAIAEHPQPGSFARNKKYLIYLTIFLGIVGMMDWYLSMLETTIKPLVIQEFGLTAPVFARWESLYLIPSFFIFLLNGLSDIIGRKYTMLILILFMGLSAFAMTMFATTFHGFMILYAIINFSIVSNLWTIPMSEESPARSRGKWMMIVFAITLIPLSGILPPLIIPEHGWRWAYGITMVIAIISVIMWPFMKETNRYYQIKEEKKLKLKKTHAYGIGVITRRDLFYIVVSVVIWASWLFVSRVLTWGGYYFMEIHGFSLSYWSILLAASGLACILGALVAGWLIDKIGRKKAYYISCIGLIVSLVLVGMLPRSLLFIAPPLAMFFLMFNYSWIVVYIPEIFPTEIRGTCLGWTTTISRGTFVLAPLVVSALLNAFPTMEMMWIIAGLFMIIPMLFVFLVRPHETMGEELEEIEVKR